MDDAGTATAYHVLISGSTPAITPGGSPTGGNLMLFPGLAFRRARERHPGPDRAPGFIASSSNANARYRYVTGLGIGDALIMGRWTADLAPVTGDYQVAVMGRVLSDQTNYQLRAPVSATVGNIQLRLVRRTSGTRRIWREGSAEPTTWLIDTTNNTAGNQTSTGGVGWQYVMSASNPATVEMRASDLLAHARSDDVPLALWLPNRQAAHHDLGWPCSRGLQTGSERDR